MDWYIQPEVEVLFPGDETAAVDLSGWRQERIAGHRNDNPITTVPDWICEVLSDSTRRKDLGPKRAMYARHRVGHRWMIDPEDRRLEAFSLASDGSNRWVLLDSFFDDDVIDIAPFAGTPIAMNNWWLREE